MKYPFLEIFYFRTLYNFWTRISKVSLVLIALKFNIFKIFLGEIILNKITLVTN